MALADCTATRFSCVGKKSNIELSKVDFAVETEKSSASSIITRVKLKVTTSAKARDALSKGAWRRTEANCPVISIFTESIPLKVKFETKPE